MTEEMDIVIPADKMGDFFFLDDEEEKKEYGASANYAQAAALTSQLVKSAEKQPEGQKSEAQQQKMDFKVRAVDFLSIYVKQSAHMSNSTVQIKLIRGLLKGLSVAHTDKHQILFDRIKSVLALMAKQGQATATSGKSQGEEGDAQEVRVLLGEMIKLLLKQQKDPALTRAYSDCLILLTKHYYDSPDPANRKTLVTCYKDLLNKILSGRIAGGAAPLTRLLQMVFESCPALAWSLSDSLLKCFLAKETPKEAAKDGDEEEVKDGAKKVAAKKENASEGSRSNHQRLQAIELYQLLLRVAAKDSSSKKVLAEKLPLLGAVIEKVVVQANNWQQKKVKKTGICVGLFAKAAKILLATEEGAAVDVNARKIVSETGVQLIKTIETATEADKTLANLKGKINEIKKIIVL